MRKTHSFEIVGIGEFDEYPAKIEEKDYAMVSKDKTIVVKKVVQQGTPTEYAYVDGNGKAFSKDEVFYDFNGKLIQKVNRTDKVSKFDVVPISEAVDCLEQDTSWIIAKSKTALDNFRAKVGKDKAVKFTYKKSSVGLKFSKAYLYEQDNDLVMITGIGSRAKSQEQFKAIKRLSEDVKKGKSKVEGAVEVVSADEVEVELE